MTRFVVRRVDPGFEGVFCATDGASPAGAPIALHLTAKEGNTMLDTEQLRTTLLHDLETLHQAREQLLFEVQVEHMDVRVHWDRIDDALRFARAEINRLGDHSEEAVQEIERASRQHLEDAMAHVAQLRATLASRSRR